MSAFLASGTDRELLRRFVEGGGEGVFAELVRRHSGLVFSTALRRSGSRELAQEAAQNVFAVLARKAARLEVAGSLAPWLHRAAVLETAALVRRESRYRHAMQRHQHEPTSQPVSHDAATAWQHVRLLVDEALDSLAAPDRRVLLLHHVEGRTFPDMAALLGQSEAAVQRRSHRALQKLADRLRRRGVPVPALTLGGALATGFAGEASAAAISAPAITTAALAQAQTTAAGLTSLLPTWAASPAVLTAVFLLSAAAPAGWRFAMHAQSTSGMALVPSEPSAPPAIAAPAATPPREIAAETRLDFLRQALAQLARTSPSEAPTRLGLQLRRHMLGLSAEDLRPVAGLLSTANRNHEETGAVIEAFSSRFAELEPEGALALLLYNPPVPPDETLKKAIDKPAIVDVLARKDFAALLQAARDDPDFTFVHFGALAQHDGRATIDFIKEAFAEDSRCAGAIYNSFDVWMNREPAEAIRWLDQNLDAHPNLLSHHFLASVGFYQPAKQAVAVATSVEDPLLRAAAIEAVSAAHLKAHPEEFAALAPFLRLEDEGKPLSVRDVIWSWRRKDAAVAAAWVEGLPEGDLKTTATRCLATPDPHAHLRQ